MNVRLNFQLKSSRADAEEDLQSHFNCFSNSFFMWYAVLLHSLHTNQVHKEKKLFIFSLLNCCASCVMPSLPSASQQCQTKF